MKTLYTYSFFAILFTFCGCEYNKDENYYPDIEKPEEITIDVSLEGMGSGQTIYIYTKTNLHYLFDFKAKEILKHQIKIGDREIHPSEDGVITLDPRLFDVDDAILSIDIELKTGTNSIAERLSYEKYVGNYQYKIKFIHNANFTLNFKNEITSDKHLKISWTAPDLEQLEIEKHEIHFQDERGNEVKITTITDPDQKYFIDNSYVLGYRRYVLVTYFKDNRLGSQWNYHTIQTEFAQDQFFSEPIGLDMMKIWWKENKYACNYAIELEDGTIIKCEQTREIEIEHNYLFPILKPVKLYMFPADYKGEVKSAPYSSQQIASKKVEGVENVGKLSYNIKDIRFYSYGQNAVTSIDGKSMSILKKKSTNASWGWQKTSLFYSNHLNKLVFCEENRFELLDNDLTTLSVINHPPDSYSWSLLHLSDNNRLIISERGVNKDMLYVYDIISGKLLYSENLPYFQSRSTFISMQGDLLSFFGGSSIEIHAFRNIEFEKIHTISTYPVNFEECLFSRVVNNDLYMINKEHFIRVNAITKAKTDYVQGQFITEDPFTGNIAILKDNVLIIMNYEMNKEIYKIPVTPTYTLALYNNILMTNEWGSIFYLDLKPYMK